jgi:4-oxalocrotonate tautomerase
MIEVLGKDPVTTLVVIDEVPLANWGYAGSSVKTRRRDAQKKVSA